MLVTSLLREFQFPCVAVLESLLTKPPELEHISSLTTKIRALSQVDRATARSSEMVSLISYQFHRSSVPKVINSTSIYLP